MDTFVTFSIVAVAALWATMRLVRRFASTKPSSACGSCTGCPTVRDTAGCSSRESRKSAAPLVLGVLALCFTPHLFARTAEESPAGVISIEGFFDIQATTRGSDPNVFSPGDFEIDLARDLGRNAQIAAAIVANEEGASVAVAFLDLHFFGGLIAPRGRLPVEKGFHIQLGRFDVPLGNDWQYFASKDRTELSAPLTTDAIMDGGLNDLGIRVIGNNRSVNYSAFVVRGEGSGNVYGSRVGFTPFHNPYRFTPQARRFEIGISLLRDDDGNRSPRATFLALDSEAQLGRWRVRTEHLRKDDRTPEENERVLHSGWHVTAAFEAGELWRASMTPYARFDTATDDLDAYLLENGRADTRRTNRITAGLNATLFSMVLLKLEHARILSAPFEVRAEDGFRRGSWRAQVVIVF